MRRTLAIFRKDARHLWPQAAMLVLLMGIAALLDPTYRGGKGIYYDILPSFALPLTCWLIVISAIHEEKLPGDRQYWLTRPYSRIELVAAKILFVAAFINLPLLAYHAAVYAAIGIPPANHLRALLWRQVFFTAFYLLPAAALAAITRSLGRAVAISVLGVVCMGAAGWVLPFITPLPVMVAVAPYATMTILRAALLAVGASAIVVLQYARRTTIAAGALAVAIGLVFCAAVAYSPAYGRQVPAIRSEARLSLDSEPDRRSDMVPGGDRDISTFDIPVRLNGAPAGMAMGPAYLYAQVYESGRSHVARFVTGQLHGLGDGRAWLSFSTDRHLLEQAQGQPMALSGDFDLQLFGSQLVLPLPKRSAVVVPGVGVCRDSLEADSSISFTCYSPLPRLALMAGIAGRRVNWIVSPASVEDSIPTASGFQPVRKFASVLSYRDWAEIGDLKLVVAQPLRPCRVTFRLFPVPLQRYLVTGRKE